MRLNFDDISMDEWMILTQAGPKENVYIDLAFTLSFIPTKTCKYFSLFFFRIVSFTSFTFDLIN